MSSESYPQTVLRSARRKAKGFVKVAAINILIVSGLFGTLESAVRVFGWDRESTTAPLSKLMDVQFQAIHRYDRLLFFSLRPNITKPFFGAIVATNSLGLRAAEIAPKAPNEFRILSLGESSAFGAGVENSASYVMQLEERLNRVSRDQKYTVINAAVSAYTSFQSRIYLEHRGLALQPDMVLLYHELNDFLPTTNRESLSPDRQGLPLTDKEAFELQTRNFNRLLLEWSALYRFVSNRTVEFRLERYQKARPTSPEHVHVPAMLQDVSTPEGMRKLNLPPRVPPADRRENFEAILALCESAGAQLIVLHPSYAESDRHDCDLTEFCRERGVPMFDVYDCLHPPDAAPGARYWDLWHPNAEGHACIGASLFDFLMREKLVPTARAIDAS